MNLETLLQRADLWRGGSPTSRDRHGVATGHPALDEALPDGGWPQGALTEILHQHSGEGELTLLLPTMVRLTQAASWVAWVAPPHTPHAAALAAAGVDLSRLLLIQPPADGALWAAEQALRSGLCGAVLCWPGRVAAKALRRLQLAAEVGGALGFMFRSAAVAATASAAALRLQLARDGSRQRVEIIKRRGGWPLGPIFLDSTVASRSNSALA